MFGLDDDAAQGAGGELGSALAALADGGTELVPDGHPVHAEGDERRAGDVASPDRHVPVVELDVAAHALAWREDDAGGALARRQLHLGADGGDLGAEVVVVEEETVVPHVGDIAAGVAAV